MTSGTNELSPTARCEWLDDFADLAYLVGHEFNNFLNNLLLHLSVLELSAASACSSPEFDIMRRSGREMAAKVRQFQQLSRTHRAPLAPTDLNQVVRKAVAKTSLRSLPLRVETAGVLPPVLAAVSDLERLIALLIEAAASAGQQPGDPIAVRTKRAAGHAELWVEDRGSAVAEEDLARLFEPFVAVRAGSDGLKLAIARAVTRQLLGNIRAENLSDGGFAVVVELRYAKE